MGKILKNLSILQKFLFINLVVFIFLGIFTFFYLGTIQKDLISEKKKSHIEIINQTILNLDKSDIKFTRNGINEFLFSKKSRFPYFEKLDRVIFFDDKLNLVGDTRSIPSSEMIIEDLLENSDNKKNISKNTKNITTVFDQDIKDYDISKSEILDFMSSIS